MATSLYIAHPARLTCELFCRSLELSDGNFRIVGCSVGAAESVRQISSDPPDVALISAALLEGPRAGFDVVHQLSLSRHATRTVMLLPASEENIVLEAFSRGAKGVVFQSDEFNVVCKCLRSVHAGQVWVSSEHLQVILESFAQRRQMQVHDAKGQPLLTKREDEVVRMLTEGLPNLEIAKALQLSPHTVKNHLFRIYEKLGISTRAELILYALSSRMAVRRIDTTA